jgi:hypothetical protein
MCPVMFRAMWEAMIHRLFHRMKDYRADHIRVRPDKDLLPRHRQELYITYRSILIMRSF